MALGRKLNTAGRAVADPFSFAGNANGGIQGNPFQTQRKHIGPDPCIPHGVTLAEPSIDQHFQDLFGVSFHDAGRNCLEHYVSSKLYGRSISRVR